MLNKFTIFVDREVQKRCAEDTAFTLDPEYLRSIDLIHEFNRYFLLVGKYQPPSWLTLENYGRLYKIMFGDSWSEGCDFLQDSKRASRVECVLLLGISNTLRIHLSVFTKGNRKPFRRHEIGIGRFGGCSIVTYS